MRAILLPLSCALLASACTRDTRTELRIIGEAYAPLDALEKMKTAYENEHGIRIVVEKYDFETAVERVALDLSSGTGRYDIVLQPHLVLGQLAERGFLEPLSAFTTDTAEISGTDPATELFPVFWRELSWYRGQTYGYPFTANTMYLWYRKDLLANPVNQQAFQARYGYPLAVPETWEQYRDIAEFFTRPNENLYGTLLQGKRHPAVWYEWLNFAYSFGGGVMRTNHAWEYGPIVINCPETVEATEFYHGLKQFSPPGTAEFTWDEALAAMQQGQVFMAIMWSDATFFVEDSTQSRVHGRMGYAPLPRGPAGKMGQIAGWSYLISRHSKNKEEAYRFIQWMMQPQNQIQQQLGGGASAMRSTYQDPRVRAIPYTDAYVATLGVARSMSGSVPETTRMSDILQVCLSDIVADRTTVAAGLDACARELGSLLRGKADLTCPVQDGGSATPTVRSEEKDS